MNKKVPKEIEQRLAYAQKLINFLKKVIGPNYDLMDELQRKRNISYKRFIKRLKEGD